MLGLLKIASQKKPINLFQKKSFLVPGHPIAGTENSGAISAKQDLFKRNGILTPLKAHKKNNIIANIWKVLGMKISLMTIDEHDKIMSITSHLPHLLAFTIVGTAFNIDLKKRKTN